MIQRLHVTSTPTDQSLLTNRSRFDLVVMYDEDSASLGSPTSPMSTHFRGIFMRVFLATLKQAPMILEGGLAAWKAALGDQGVIRGPSPSSVGPELRKVFPPGASPVAEETFLYPRPTGIGYPRGDNGTGPYFSSVSW
jgi:hypothetical protein